MPTSQNVHLRGFRKRSSLTQPDVGRLLGYISASPVSRLEAGEQRPDFKTALCLELIYGAPASQLFRDIYKEIAARVRDRATLLMEGLRLHRETPEVRQRIGEIKAIIARVDTLGA